MPRVPPGLAPRELRRTGTIISSLLLAFAVTMIATGSAPTRDGPTGLPLFVIAGPLALFCIGGAMLAARLCRVSLLQFCIPSYGASAAAFTATFINQAASRLMVEQGETSLYPAAWFQYAIGYGLGVVIGTAALAGHWLALRNEGNL